MPILGDRVQQQDRRDEKGQFGQVSLLVQNLANNSKSGKGGDTEI
jgi:hypothetical protein